IFHRSGVVEERNWKIDRHIELPLLGPEVTPIGECLIDDELRQRPAMGIARGGHKIGGLDNSQLRVTHANERFGPAQIECLAANLGLIPQFEPAIAQRLRDIDCASGQIGAPIISHIDAGHIVAPAGSCRGDRFGSAVVFREQGEVTAVGDLRIDGARARGRSLLQLWPYIWPADRRDLKARVIFATVLLFFAKLATVAVPFTFKWATDALAGRGTAPIAPDNWLAWAFTAPIVMTLAYGGTRILMGLLTQWRDGIFAKVAMNAVRRLA